MPKILVADDNANIQKMVSLSFEDRGVQVVSVGNGEAAVRRIPDVKPDLVLADIFMPVRNGYEVCEFVKKDERFSHVPVILLVGAFDPLDEKEARRVGADGVLKKPFVPPDPLIAMVMSALEKNPKVAAELAKAREAKEAPPPPAEEPIPAPATSVRADLKPLPDFPEPSPEEAALVYGFGTGKRALDDAPVEAEAASGPKAPAAEPDEAADEEFDNTSTRRDWRRNAMEIDIPPDAAKKPAFAIDDEPETTIFPSERDVPPRRVPFPEPEIEPQSVALAKSEEPATPLVSVAPVQPEPPAATPISSAADSDFFASVDATEPTSALVEPVQAEVHVPLLSAEPAEPEPVLDLGTIEPPDPPTVAESVAPLRPEPEPMSQAPSHWMDQLAQGSPDRAPSDWMSTLSEQTTKNTISEISEPIQGHANVAAAPTVEASLEANTEISESPISKSELETHSDASAWLTPEAPAMHEESAAEAFFADDEVPSKPATDWMSPAEHLAQLSAESAIEAVETTASDAAPVSSAKADDSFETDSEPETNLAYKDPDLVEPPAVHVTPEPLLIEDEAPAPTHYGSGEVEDVRPMSSFFVPPSPVSDPEELISRDIPTRSVTPSPIFATQPAEHDILSRDLGEDDERIPTGPPPSREALAEIPFLTPPPEFHTQPREQAAANSQTVDAVVQKVLEKLQPQLQDLLSQGVLKPLVENLLQNEIEKKEK